MSKFKFKANVVRDEDGISVFVETVEPKLDRPQSRGWSVKDEKMAARLSRAIEAGAVSPNPEVREDVNGETFMSCGVNVMGRRMNADLKRLGF